MAITKKEFLKQTEDLFADCGTGHNSKYMGFQTYIDQLFLRCYAELSERNSEYTEGNTNPFFNFELANKVGITSEQAIAMRMVNKVARLMSHEKLADEHFDDVIRDLINYASLLRSYLIYVERSQTPQIKNLIQQTALYGYTQKNNIKGVIEAKSLLNILENLCL